MWGQPPSAVRRAQLASLFLASKLFSAWKSFSAPPASYDLLRRILATLRPQERAMTAATPGPSGPNIFTMFSSESGLYRAKREAFVFSLAGQAAILAVLIYLTSRVISPPITIRDFAHLKELPL